MKKERVNDYYNAEWSDRKVIADAYRRLWRSNWGMKEYCKYAFFADLIEKVRTPEINAEITASSNRINQIKI